MFCNLMNQEQNNMDSYLSLKREIQLARKIQRQLLNGEKPVLPNSEVSGFSIPARMIGGDYFDFYPLSDGRVRIIIGDVMGKGIPAAMLMILTRGAFRSAAEVTQGPGETLTSMNKAIYKDLRTLNSFVTVFCADWDPVTGNIVYANAGHYMPVLVRENLEAFELPDLKGVMLGGLPDQVYQEKQLRLLEGDTLFFYTDGIVEAQNGKGEMFQIERLNETLIQNAHKTASELETIVIETLTSFTEGSPQRDDITMVILKVGKGRDDQC
ncbi:PP2C family protein-serine/threonine phosphatase [Brevibacillus sp. GCM10020057]|uniref:PP2C family protein-serine/threonine phosphatase n=1 Tax=Brevibacillus sp. GCM10020057 TaxID=3317327 RepID=UPI003638A02D